MAPPDSIARRLPTAFHRLWAGAIAGNLADGLGRTAIPLVATTLTRDPLLISGITAVAFLPWLLFGLPAGILVDRIDRRIAMASANGLRVLMALVVALAISTGTLTIWLLYACILIWGVGETVFDTSTNAVVPSLVPVRQLEKANSRIQGAQLVLETFVGAPISGMLFAVAIAVPIWSTAAGFAVSAALVLFLPLSAARAARDAREATVAHTGVHRIWHEAGESLGFLWRHRLLRGLLVITTLTGGMLSLGQASMVLFFLDTMGVPASLLGVVEAAIGVGGLLGALSASRLVARFGRARIMWSSTVVAGLMLAIVGVVPNLPLALISYAISAYAVSVWNVPWSALRQQLIPGALLGRTIGFMRSMTWGVIPLATLIGGVVARVDLRAPFLIGGVGVLLISVFGAGLLLSVDRIAAGANAP